MRPLLGRAAKWAGGLAIIIVMAIAIARFMLPRFVEGPAALETMLASAFGRPVTVGAVDFEWRGWSPSFHLREVRLLNKDRAPVLSIAEVYAMPDLLSTFLSGGLKLEHLRLTGADIHLVREADGEIRLRGMEYRPQDRAAGLSEISLSLDGSQVNWADRMLGVEYQFDDVHVRLETRGEVKHLAAKLRLPRALGEQLTLRAHFQGALAEQASSSGKVYLKLDRVRLAALPEALRWKLAGGRISAEGWMVWRHGVPATAVGHMQASDVVLGGNTAGSPTFERLRTRFRWSGEASAWLLQLANLELSREGRTWSADTARFRYRADQGRRVAAGRLSYARIEDLVALLAGQASADDRLGQVLTTRSPSGELKDARFSIELLDGEIGNYSAGGQFENLAVEAADAWPALAGADGQFSLTRGGGELALASHDLRFEYPRLFAHPLTADYLNGRVRWQQGEDGVKIDVRELALGNDDLETEGEILLRLGADGPHLDMQLALADGDVARLQQYLPVKILKPKIIEWLERALVDGRLTEGQVTLKGDPRLFPFREDEGQFEARLNIEQGVLDYRPGWPRAEDIIAEVVFQNDALAAASQHARILGSAIQSAAIRIPELRAGQLQLEAAAQGPLPDLITYLRAADLVQPEAFKILSVQGASRLKLTLALPLSKEHPGEERVSVDVDVSNGKLRIVPAELVFNAIDGRLNFSLDEGFSAQGIEGRLRGQAVEADVTHDAGRRTQISVQGRLPAAVLLRDLKHPMWRQIRGASFWQADVLLPAFRRRDEQAPPSPRPVYVSLRSKLEGTLVELPYPLEKAADEQRQFTIATEFGGGVQHPVRLTYGQHISAVLALTRDAESMRLTRGELRINRGPAELPPRGLAIKADLARFSVSQWQAWLQGNTEVLVAAGESAQAGALQDIDLAIARLEWAGRTIDDLRLSARLQHLRWLIEVDSSHIKGHIIAPARFEAKSPLVADLEHLRLTSSNSGRPAALDPRRLPSMDVRSQRLEVGELEFSSLHLKTTRVADGMLIDVLELSAENFHGGVHGDWKVIGEGRQRSTIQADLESADIGLLLRAWDLLHSVRDGKAHLEASLDWPDAPYRLSPTFLNGSATLEVKDGRLRELDPGAGRLLGLLNLDAISRRLALDFSDLFRTGFSFDTIEGQFEFDDGSIHTDDLVMIGPSAEIDINGRAGLVKRDLELLVSVTPQIISGLPLAGAILGGPAVGAAIYLAEKVAEQIGRGVGQGSGIRYRVTGSWSDPQVNLIKPPAQTPQAQETFPHNIR